MLHPDGFGVVQMDLTKLFGMRPKTEGIADIEAALAAALAAGEAAARAEAALLAKRGDVLLSGTPEEVTRAEEALARARTEADHAATMVPILEAKLADAMREKKLAELRAAVARANRMADQAADAIRQRYTQLAAAMVQDVLIPEAEACAALDDAVQMVQRELRGGCLTEPLSDDLKLRPRPMMQVCPPGATLPRDALGAETILPGLAGRGFPMDAGSPLWPVMVEPDAKG